MRTSALLLPLLGLIALSCTDPPPPRPPEPSSAEPEPGPVASSSAPVAPVFVPKKVSLEQGAMGTKVTIVAYTSPTRDVPEVGGAVSKAYREIVRLEKVMSTWVPESDVSRVNEAAGKAAVKVGPDTLAVVDKSLSTAKASEGVFDITFEAMKGLWRFDNGGVDIVPPKADVERARKLVDFRQVEIDVAASTVKLTKPTARINLGGIAKGYAVDAAAKILEEGGVSSFFIQAGGDLYVRGKKPDGSRFRVGVRDPRGKYDTDYFAMMEVEDHAFSTAGDYERAFVKDGKRYHHIIDPRTGYPATACRSVTVWAPNAFIADSLDDAVFILGPEKGLALIEATEGAGAVVVDASNKVWISSRLSNLVHKDREPTDAP